MLIIVYGISLLYKQMFDESQFQDTPVTFVSIDCVKVDILPTPNLLTSVWLFHLQVYTFLQYRLYILKLLLISLPKFFGGGNIVHIYCL